MSDLPGYDAWKLACPYDSDEPERQEDAGKCRLCNGSGEIAMSLRGRYVGAGPVPDYARGVRGVPCDSCGGVDEIFSDEDGSP